MEVKVLEAKLKDKEEYLEKIKAEQYATAGQIVLLKQMIDELKNPKKVDPSKKDG